MGYIFPKGEMYVNFYCRLRDLWEDHDLVQKEVAALLGIDQRVYSNYKAPLPVSTKSRADFSMG